MYSAEEFDKCKTKVLKYIMYKKRSENEVRNKFSKTIPSDMLEDIIEYLKETKYIDDSAYIKKSIQEFMVLKNMSLKEINFKLWSKGVNKNLLEDYMYENEQELEEYEIRSATNIILKKQTAMDENKIKQYLLKKGYKLDNIKIAFDNISE